MASEGGSLLRGPGACDHDRGVLVLASVSSATTPPFTPVAADNARLGSARLTCHGATCFRLSADLAGSAAPRPAFVLHTRGRKHRGQLQLLHDLRDSLNKEASRFAGAIAAQLAGQLTLLKDGCTAAAARVETHHGLSEHFKWRPWQIFRHRPDGSETLAAAELRASSVGQQWVQRGLARERELRLEDAISCYEQALATDPHSAEFLSRLSKAWSDRTYEEGAGPEHVEAVNQKAMELAKRAMEADPAAAWGYIASCVSKGRLAVFSEGRTKVLLAKEAQDEAIRALALEPGNDLAHHLMGRWHYEMAGLNFVLRTLVRVLYGAALAPGSYTDALREFQSAASLAPGRLIHHVEVARCCARLGEREAALEALTTALECDDEDVNAVLQRQDAHSMQQRLQGEVAGGVLPFWPR